MDHELTLVFHSVIAPPGFRILLTEVVPVFGKELKLKVQWDAVLEVIRRATGGEETKVCTQGEHEREKKKKKG